MREQRCRGRCRRCGGASGGYVARSMDLVDLVCRHVSKVLSLRALVSSDSGNRRVDQSLIWNQRRRTMSHTPYCIPARLNSAHCHELALSVAPGAPIAPDRIGIVERAPGPLWKMRCRGKFGVGSTVGRTETCWPPGRCARRAPSDWRRLYDLQSGSSWRSLPAGRRMLLRRVTAGCGRDTARCRERR